jgi:TPR repeat protein
MSKREWYDNARDWYERSAKQGYAPAQMALGEKWKNGELWGLDFEKACFWYKLAEKQYYPGAKQFVKFFTRDGLL